MARNLRYLRGTMEWADSLDIVPWMDTEIERLKGLTKEEIPEALLEIEKQFRILHPRQKITLLMYLVGELVRKNQGDNT